MVVAVLVRLYNLGWGLPHFPEEAKPLHVAFQMWGWDRAVPVNLNPGFFNYPSLVLYVHFVAQGLAYLFLKLSGAVTSLADWQVMFLVDPTPVYKVERGVGVLFGAGTVYAIAMLGRSIAGGLAGAIGALLLAINAFHAGRSQHIEVDVPLAFFCVVCLWAITRVVIDGMPRSYLAAGVALGLAASSKYTGAFLLIPLILAHLAGERRRQWRYLASAGALAFLAFAVTSPFVLIDFAAFWRDITAERSHMSEGHFGLSGAASWAAYARSMWNGVVTAPVCVLALVGGALLVRRRNRAGMVTIAFAVVYLITIGSWKMRADHYLLPVIPVILMLSGVALAEMLRRDVRGRVAALVLLVVLVGADARRIAANVSATRSDARALATRWIEANVPAKALVVMENYGPALLGAPLLLQLDPGLRAQVVDAQHDRPVYGLVHLPMTQTAPEQSTPFYTPDLYGDADIVVTSSVVRDRYERDPARFAEVIGFYEWVDSSMELVKHFPSNGDGGVEIKIYASRGAHPAFGDRKTVPEPARLPAATVARNGAMYFERAANYEYFGFGHQAYVCYVRALETEPANRQIYLHCVLGATRVLVANGQVETAVRVLEQAEAIAPDEDARQRVANMKRQLAAGR